MSRFLRIALLWLLALAVPAQGFAAASMLNCGPGHHGRVSDQARTDNGHDHGGMAGLAADPVPDEDAAIHADEPGTQAASADREAAPVHHGLHKGKTGSCSACASCCTAAAPPSAAPAFEASPAPEVFPLPAPLGVAAFLTDGPERPPRFFLA